MRPGGYLFQLIAGLVQHRGHGTGAGRQGGAAQQHVADALAAPGGVALLEQQDGAPGQVRQPAAGRRPAWLVHQSGRTLLIELLLPAIEGVLGQPDQGGEVAGRQAAAWPGVEQEQALLGRQRRGLGPALLHQAPPVWPPAPSWQHSIQTRRRSVPVLGRGQLLLLVRRQLRRLRRSGGPGVGDFSATDCLEWLAAWIGSSATRARRRCGWGARLRLVLCKRPCLVGFPSSALTRSWPQKLQHTSSLSADCVRTWEEGICLRD